MVALNKAIDKQLLKGLSPMGKLTHDKIDDIISKSRVENLPAGRIIFREGEDDGHSIYLLSGQIELSTAGKTHKQTIKGKSVEAKFPIADQIPRPATARTKTASSLLYIDSSLLEILLDENPSGEYEVTEIDVADHATDWMMRFLQSRAFLKLPTRNIQKVLMSMEETLANKGETIVKQGDEGDYYYIIKHGCCTVSRRPAEKSEEIRLAKVVEGDGFGEEALITNCKRNASVTAQENVTLMRLKKDDFLNLLVTPLIRNVHLNSLKSSLYKNAIILDIRTSNEFKQGSLDKAKHIPLSMIRLRIPTLDSSKQHLIYSDNEADAKAATFLLSQHGIDCLVILGSLHQTILRSEETVENKKPLELNKKAATPILKVVSSDSLQKQTNDISSTKQQASQPAEFRDERAIESANHISEDKAEKQNNIQSKLNAKADKMRLQARKEAEQMLAEAKAIRLSAIQDASRLRDKVEKEATLKLRTELTETRNRAEAAIKKSEQLAEQIRQQAEQESSQIRNQALNDTEKLKKELKQLREHEMQMKHQLEAELLAIRQQATEQARLQTEQKSEHARIAAQHAAEQARTTALREAEEARAAAEQTAVEAKAVADRLTAEAKSIEKEAIQAHRKAQREAEVIRQTAWQEANRIKQNALKESKQIKQTASVESQHFISHDNVFNFDDELSPTTEPVLPYADEASVALKMAEEIKIKLAEVEEQRIINEQRNLQKPVNCSAQVKRRNDKLIIESTEDIFSFTEPKKPSTKQSAKNTIEPSSSALSQQNNTTVPLKTTIQEQETIPLKTTINELPTTDKWSMTFNSTELPVGQPDNNYVAEDKENNKSILAIAASIFLVIVLSLAAYTTKIQINFSEVSALVNQDSIENEVKKVKIQARKDFRKKISSIKRK